MLITNFASGELSPTLNGRIDLQQYYQSASYLKNFEVIPTGGIKRRTGFKRLGQLHENARIIPFIINSTKSYILEMIPGHIYLWKNGKKMLNEDGSHYGIESPYLSLEVINKVHYAQNYDTMFFVHQDYNPISLKIDLGTETLTLTQEGFTFIPDINLDDDFDIVVKVTESTLPTITISPDGFPIVENKTYKHGLYCTFNGQLFKAEYKTDLYKWEKVGTDPQINADLFTTEGNYPGAISFFNNRLWLASTKNEPQKIWASNAPDKDGNRYTDFSTYQKYVTVEETYKNPDLHIFSGTVDSSDKYKIKNVTQDFTKSGILSNDLKQYYLSGNLVLTGTKIVSITPTTITVDTPLNVSSGSYSGYEFSIQLWKSPEVATEDDKEYIVANNNITTSDCSLNFELASSENDAIKFLAANNNLIVGTESTIWAVPSTITALNILVENQGRYGSSEIQALSIDKATVFFAQGKKGIREFYYDNVSEAFHTNNIAILSQHLLEESKVHDFDYLNNPYNKLIITREDGKQAILLYDKNNAVMAWYRYEHGNCLIKSAATTLGEQQNDLLYVAVSEKTDENTFNYYLECLDSNNEIYLDSWKLYNKNTENLDGYSDKAILFNSTKNKTCSIKDIPEDFIDEDDVVYIGYLYESDIISMPIVNNDPTGKKRITSLIVRFLDSYLPTIKITGNEDESFYGVEVPFSGIKTITYPGVTDRDVKFEMITSEPYPVSILSVNATTA